MQRKFLWSVSLAVLVTVILIFPLTHVYAIQNVKWKIFKEKGGLFTIKYPANWIPQKISLNQEINPPLSINFVYSGPRLSGAIVGVSADESILTNTTDLIDSMFAYGQSFLNFRVLQPMECGKYMINGIKACSIVLSYKNTILPGRPTMNELDIATIDENGVQYVIYYMTTKDLFESFLPLVEEMVGSFNVTGNLLNPGGQLTQGSQDSEQPLFSEPSEIKGF